MKRHDTEPLGGEKGSRRRDVRGKAGITFERKLSLKHEAYI